MLQLRKIKLLTTYLNFRYIHIGKKIEVDPNAIDKLKVARGDFIYSLETDVKPMLGTSDEELEKFIERGIVSWGPTKELLEKGMMFVNQAKSPLTSSRLCLLLEGKFLLKFLYLIRFLSFPNI